MFLARLALTFLFISAFILCAANAPWVRNVSAETLANFPVGVEPKSVAIGDFNNDGKKDLAVCNRGSQDVSILLGDGAGSFAPAVNFPVSPEPFALDIGDFNNDGKSDVVVASPNVHKVWLMLGDGNGVLAAPVGFDVGENPAKFAVGDFNGDNNRDLAVADFGFNQGGVYIMLGNGTGSFSAPTRFNTGPRPRYVAIADFNGDSKSDLVVANVNSNKISILLGNGNGGFPTQTDFTVGTSPIGLALADFNSDTILDIAVANADSHNVSILKGDGNGSFSPAVNFPAFQFPLSITAGDFNNDGKSDLAIGGGAGTLVLIGDGAGQFGPPSSFTSGNGPYDLTSGDLNNDSKSDIVVANASSQNVTVLLGSTPSVTISGVTLTEGDSGMKNANFTLTLSGASDKSISVGYLVVAGTAEPISDYDHDAASAGSPVIIPPGGLGATITVPIFGDRTFEPDETFTVVFTNVTNVYRGNDRATGTIVNDDPVPTITVSDATTVEGSVGSVHPVPLVVSLSNPSSQTVTVLLTTSDITAAAGSDYTQNSATVTFTPGQTIKGFNVFIRPDTISEPNETFMATATLPVNATIVRAQAIATIIDDDAPALLTEENSQRAIAIDSVLMLRDPFPIVNDLNFSSDHRSRIALFAVNLNLAAGEVITMQAEDAQHVVSQLPVEYVGLVANFGGMTQLVVKLPDQLANAGEVKVSFTLRGVASNQVLVSIRP